MNGLKSSQSSSGSGHGAPVTTKNTGKILGWLFRRSGGSSGPGRAERLHAKEAARDKHREIPMPASEDAANGPGRRLAKPKSILLVAADDLGSRLWRRELEEWGYVVEVTDESEIALDKLFDIGYDALLMDWEAPKIAGAAALEEIRAEELFKAMFVGVFVREQGGDTALETNALAAGASKVFRRQDTNADPILAALKASLFPRVMQVTPRSRQVRPAAPPMVPSPLAPSAPAPTPTIPAPGPLTPTVAGGKTTVAAVPAFPEPPDPAPRAPISLGAHGMREIKGPDASGPKRVLVIEDDETLANAYRRQLEAAGYAVEVVHDGTTGFHDVLTTAPDAILVDLFLPGFSGLDIIKKTRVQRRFERLPILVFSSAYSRETEAQAREAGATHFFDKSTARPGEVIRALNDLFFPNRREREAVAPPADAAVAVPPSPPAPAVPAPADDTLKNEIRNALRRDAPDLVKSLRAILGAFLRAHAGGDLAVRGQSLLELQRRIHSLVGNAAIGGFPRVARLASALDALLREFQERADSINPSTQRTLTQAIDLLAQLFGRAGSSDEDEAPMGDERILVVDDEVISRRVLGHSLEKAKLQPTAVDHPQAALGLLEQGEPFDLIFLDVEMPDMNGYELCKKIRAIPRHNRTPILFVTALSSFDNRAKSTLSGGDDFIGKPFSYIELAVKALVFVLRGRSPAHATLTVRS